MPHSYDSHFVEGVEDTTSHEDNEGDADEQHESNHVKEEKDGKEDRQSIKTTKDLLERMIGVDGKL